MAIDRRGRVFRSNTSVSWTAKSPVLICCLAATVAMQTGCSWQTDSGRAYLVLGLGVVHVADDMASHEIDGTFDARAGRDEAVGVMVGGGPLINGFLIGYLKRQHVSIRPEAEVLLGASSMRDGAFTVTATMPLAVSPARASRAAPEAKETVP